MLPDLFQSSQQYKKFFTESLLDLLDSDQLGVFILVLANASIQAQIQRPLDPALKQRFSQLSQQLQTLSNKQLQQIPPDDLAVFRQLEQLGYENLEPGQQKFLGVWQLQFNQLRSFRPARNSQKTITELHQPFDHNGFHFNKPFLAKEILWQGSLEKIPVRFLFNKFPFADYHTLVLLHPESNKPQFLHSEDCAEMQQVMQSLSSLSGLGMAYNSLGAFASINHQHWQCFVREQAYPVELACWTHNGGELPYPVNVESFLSLQEIWPRIKTLQQQNRAFNLFMRADRGYLAWRKSQGTYQHAGWTSGFAWSEIMGNITALRRVDYDQLDSAKIVREFESLKIEA